MVLCLLPMVGSAGRGHREPCAGAATLWVRLRHPTVSRQTFPRRCHQDPSIKCQFSTIYTLPLKKWQ